MHLVCRLFSGFFISLFLASFLTVVWPIAELKAALPLKNDAKIEISIKAYDLAALPPAGINKSNDPQLQNARALLCVTLDPGAGRYLYAPFSDEAPQPDADELALIAELSRPVNLELPLFNAAIFYPSGKLQYDEFSGLRLPVYNSPPTIQIYLPDEALGQPLTLKLDALICSAASCLPYKAEHNFMLAANDLLTTGLPPLFTDESLPRYREMRTAIADTEAKNDSALSYQQRFDPQYAQSGLEVSGLGRAILLGLLAGFILNFMPCVLPVITLKLGTLVGLGGWQGLAADSIAAKRGRARFRTYSLFFALGVLTWFGALFAVIGLAGLLWGQLFQSQTLLLALALLLFMLALSLFGVFHLPVLSIKEAGILDQTKKMSAANAPGSKNNLAGKAFAGGLLATLLATPCSGPLLGGVLGWAVGQPLHFLAITLFSVGLGMASPFLLLSLKPGLARFLPKPGAWSLTLEKILAFLLLATVIYLLSMLPEQTLITTLTAMLLLGAAAWIWNWRKGLITHAAALSLTVFALYLAFGGQTLSGRDISGPTVELSNNRTEALANNQAVRPDGSSSDQADQPGHWQNFTPEGFEAALGKENLLLEFTADWCINCRAMEATTLSAARRAKWAKEYGLHFIKVDITRSNPAGEELLAALGSGSIPLLAIFPADGQKRTNERSEATELNGSNRPNNQGEAAEPGKASREKAMQPLVLRDLITPGQLESALREHLQSAQID
ncbi:MAG: thioredoxin family protein [Deltaproteobacteria bacterium]|jgi:thiol:disulfide interchange protein DsbD|nr:thioredoxin family protein [Deltaproteobacteria bacterium]